MKPSRLRSAELPLSRRSFLEKSTILAAGAAAGLSMARSAHAAGGDTIKIGLIGCGGRGTGAAAEALTADPGTQLIAIGDAFADKLGASLANLKKTPVADRVLVEPDHCFVGLDAYQKVLASGVDLVILAAPCAFRPPHLKAAIEAGKHVFCEKPMAVDTPGLRAVIAAVELAKKNSLAIRAGLCFRFDLSLQEAVQRVQDGAIGKVLSIYAARMGNSLSAKFFGERKPECGDLEWQMRNWRNYRWLSGDGMLEVAVHEIDKMAWFLRDVPPAKCVASGGRGTPAPGNVFDHFDIVYEYADETPVIHKARYQDNCFGEYRQLIIGSKGRCTLGWNTAKIEGENEWKYKGEKFNMTQREHDVLFQELRAGKIPNDGHYMVNSTMMGIMSRMSAYTGKEITWEMAMNSTEDTMPANLAWDMTLPVPDLCIPGITEFK